MKIDESVKNILEHFPKIPETLTPELIQQIREDQALLIPEKENRPYVKTVENRLIDWTQR